MAELVAPVRNRYFYGKLLDADHLELEQRYFLERGRLLNRLTLGRGVLCGLKVEREGNQVVVWPGVAVDGLGREIVVTRPLRTDPWELEREDDSGDNEEALVLLLCYHECDAEPAPVLVADCEIHEECVPSVVRERFTLRTMKFDAERYREEHRHDAGDEGEEPEHGDEEHGPVSTTSPCGALSDPLPSGGATGSHPETHDIADAPGTNVGLSMNRRDYVFDKLRPSCAAAPDCVPLALVLGSDNRTTFVADWPVRTTIYSNSMLLELILCLVDRLEECCAERPPTKTLKLAADFPLQGSHRVQTDQMVRAIEFVLAQAGSKAGDHTVEFEAHDDSTLALEGRWDEGLCTGNARAYVGDESVVGVIGTYNSGCAAAQLRILNEASLAIVSPSNTYAGLTKGGLGAAPGEPDLYYDAPRNYLRVVATDDRQGELAAQFMKGELQLDRVFVLDDKELYGRGLADAFEGTAGAIGLDVVGRQGWDKDAPDYEGLMSQIRDSDVNGIFIAGFSANNGGQLIRDKVAIVGNNEDTKMLLSDGFVISSLFDDAGADNVAFAYATAPTLHPTMISGAPAEFVRALQEHLQESLEPYAIYAATAAQVLLDAIARSDGTRADVVAKLYDASPVESAVGPMSFDENGDAQNIVMTVYVARDRRWELELHTVLSP
jgi:branched-chain amino acid transport system substrate-binding protein